jgi:signal transduction histidine kinase
MKAEVGFQLTVTSGAQAGRSIGIGVDAVLIGRDPQCDVILPDDQASRRHARLAINGDACSIQDLGSRNGTTVNGRRITQASIHPGDTIRIGETDLRLDTVAAADDGTGWIGADHGDDAITVDADSFALLYTGLKDPAYLHRAHADLGVLYRIGQAIGDTLDVEPLVARILETLLYEIPLIGRASVYLTDGDGGALRCAGVRTRGNRAGREPAFSRTMARRVISNRQAVLTFDALQDPRFRQGDSILSQGIRAAMCAPLMSREKAIGVIYVDAVDAANRFEEDDLKLVAAIGQQAAVAIENAQLYQQLAQEKSALQEAHLALQAAQEKLVHSAKMAVVGQMASGIVHDLKNPLAILQLTHHLLHNLCRRAATLPEFLQRMAELVDDLGSGLTQCKEVVDSLLEFARPSQLTMSEVAISDLVAETVRFLRHKTGEVGVRVEMQLDPSMPTVRCDAGRIKQVLVNIVLNAVQALDKTPKTVEITTGVNAGWPSPMAFIRVQDNGKGMTPEQRRRIFDPFFTTKEPSHDAGGIGLGMSISARLVESHGGRIDVSSRLGHGSTVTVLLPLAAEPGEEDVSRQHSGG